MTTTTRPTFRVHKQNNETVKKNKEKTKRKRHWKRRGDELAAIREMGTQTNELLNIYMSFAMGENPLVKATTTTIEQQGYD